MSSLPLTKFLEAQVGGIQDYLQVLQITPGQNHEYSILRVLWWSNCKTCLHKIISPSTMAAILMCVSTIHDSHPRMRSPKDAFLRVKHVARLYLRKSWENGGAWLVWKDSAASRAWWVTSQAWLSRCGRLGQRGVSKTAHLEVLWTKSKYCSLGELTDSKGGNVPIQ